MRRPTTARRFAVASLALSAALLLATAACARPPSNATAASQETVGVDAADMSFVQSYVGYAPGKIDPQKKPITIGFTSQQGGQQQFPESAAGFEATVKFMNDEYGGFDGHRINLQECFIQAEEDGQRCATEFVNNAVDIVVKGITVLGADSFVATINGRMPIYSPSFVVPADSAGKDVYTANPGSLRLVAQADIIRRQFPAARNIALIYQDNPSGKAAYQLLVQRLQKFGDLAMKGVPVADTATATDITSALQSAGGSTADVVIPVATSALCIALAEGMQSLGITHASVVATSNCYADPVLDKFGGQLPEGWYFIDNGVNPYVVDSASGTHLFKALMQQHPVGKKFSHAGYALDSFGTVLHIAKLVHQIGPDAVTPDAFRTALRDYKGPVVGRAGDFDCGATKGFPALCMNNVGLSQWKDGKMVAIASAQSGEAIKVVP
ncbi:MAG TPA: ABC transporter substrate-binding protein [Amycolatopsis sp.]|nr:ABC transporter substrate-binding protein [Amycolatopsis sp.]